MFDDIREYHAEFKADIRQCLRDLGIFPVVGMCLLYLLVVIICLPFMLVFCPFYVINERSKTWFKSSDQDVSGDV